MRRGTAYGLALSLAILVVPIFAAVASADPIGGPDCQTCFGGIYTLQFTPPDDGSVTITYTADLTGPMSDNGTALTDIDAISFKVVSGNSGQNPNQITGGSLDSFTVDGVASNAWGTDFRISAIAPAGAGCDASATPGDFVCSQAAGGVDNGPATGHLYQWTFTIDYTGALFTGLDQATIKADFSPGNGHILSEHITLQDSPPSVPEPGTLMLLGTGLAGLGVARRLITRRRQ